MRTSRRTHRRGEHGFTLAELAVVMVIITMVLAAALPNFIRRTTWQQVQGAAREMSTRIAFIRQMCVAKRVPYRLDLDRTDHSYYFERQNPDSSWVLDPNTVFQVSGAAAMTSTANGDPTQSQIYFQTGGTIQSNDVPLQVHFISARGDTGTVTLVCTGRVTVRMFRVGS